MDPVTNLIPESCEAPAADKLTPSIIAPDADKYAVAERPKDKPPAMAVGGRVAALVPHTFDETYRLAKAIATAGWAPKSYLADPKKPDQGYSAEKISLGILHGMEVGLTPMMALQSIAVINGTPSLWGDGALAVVRASGLLLSLVEEPIMDAEGKKVAGYRCTAVRRNQPEPITRTFTTADAEKAGLLGKPGPWQDYRARMLQMRARAFVLRDGFSDALRGLSIAEEAMDIKPIPEAAPKPAKAADQQSALDAFSGSYGGAK